MYKPNSYFVSESIVTSQKVTQEIIINLLQKDGRLWSVHFSLFACVLSYFWFCVAHVYAQWDGKRVKGNTQKEREMERQK